MGEADSAEPKGPRSAGGNRKDPRATALTVSVRYKSATVGEFAEAPAHDVGLGGFFVKTRAPLAPGTLIKFELQVAGGDKPVEGVGRVVWQRAGGPSEPDGPSGMGVKFVKLHGDPGATLDAMVTESSETGTSSIAQEPAQEHELGPLPPAAPAPREAQRGEGPPADELPPKIAITVPSPVLSQGPAPPRVIVEPGTAEAAPSATPATNRDRPTQHSIRLEPADLIPQPPEAPAMSGRAFRLVPTLLLTAAAGVALVFLLPRPAHERTPGRQPEQPAAGATANEAKAAARTGRAARAQAAKRASPPTEARLPQRPLLPLAPKARPPSEPPPASLPKSKAPKPPKPPKPPAVRQPPAVEPSTVGATPRPKPAPLPARAAKPKRKKAARPAVPAARPEAKPRTAAPAAAAVEPKPRAPTAKPRAPAAATSPKATPPAPEPAAPTPSQPPGEKAPSAEAPAIPSPPSPDVNPY